MTERAFDAYFICTSPRSGSTLLCKLMQASGSAGVPESWFHTPSIDAWCRYYGLEDRAFASEQAKLSAIFNAAIKQGKGDSDVFGLRLQAQSLAFFVHSLSQSRPDLATDHQRIEAVFGKTLFIHLERTNKLDQAISYIKAEQTGLWHRHADGTEMERLSAPKEPIFDRKAIAAQIAVAKVYDEAWASWFEAEQINPLRIAYDHLAKDPRSVVQRVLLALGKNAEPTQALHVPVRKLADQINEDWARRFRDNA